MKCPKTEATGMNDQETKHGMKRREALRRLVIGSGVSVALPTAGRAAPQGPASPSNPPETMALGCAVPPDPALSSKDWKPVFFDSHQNETVVALSDWIIPDTDTPGAKAAQVNRFIDLLLGAETVQQQKQYIEALSWLDGYCLSHYSRPFTSLQQDEQSAVLTLLTHASEAPEIRYGSELFRVLKDSIVQAYYTSEIGMLEELKYQTNPFQPSFPGCTNQPNHQKL
jgi:hypothetical protein